MKAPAGFSFPERSQRHITVNQTFLYNNALEVQKMIQELLTNQSKLHSATVGHLRKLRSKALSHTNFSVTHQLMGQEPTAYSLFLHQLFSVVKSEKMKFATSLHFSVVTFPNLTLLKSYEISHVHLAQNHRQKHGMSTEDEIFAHYPSQIERRDQDLFLWKTLSLTFELLNHEENFEATIVELTCLPNTTQ
ncbi:hypothetical protein C0J52_02465 [Blattella germanica]|nr:hypothetical protein C0J52_02465 [Blattella germanica]